MEFAYKCRGSAIYEAFHLLSRFICFRRPLGSGDQNRRLLIDVNQNRLLTRLGPFDRSETLASLVPF
jgi:hypothetical protein